MAATQIVDQMKASIYDLLFPIIGAKVVTIEVSTNAKLKKTGNPFNMPVEKFSRYNGMLNCHYEKNVLAQLEREGKSPEDFKQGSSWHTAVLDEDGRLTPFCKHKQTGELYLRFRHLVTVGTPSFIDSKGNLLTFEEVEPYLPKKSNYENQGLEKAIKIITVSLENIQSITLDGKTHLFVPQRMTIR